MIEFLSANEVRIVINKKNKCDKWSVFANSITGRSLLQKEQPPEIVLEVMEVWGDMPTVEDVLPPEFPPAPPPASPSPQEDADALIIDHEYRLALLELGVN